MQEDIYLEVMRTWEYGYDVHPREGVFVMGVAAHMLDMHPQTLRKYERVGLVMPSRTPGKPRSRRMYSEEDIARLKLIKHLVDNVGLNLAGVHMAMKLFNRLIRMRARLAHLEGQPLRKALNDSLDDMFNILAG